MTILTAFRGQHRLAQGSPETVALALHAENAGPQHDGILVFDAAGRGTDLDLSGSAADVQRRYRPDAAPTPRGRPKLGVVAREVTLLPRHWDWLRSQRGGASAAIRRLIDEARQSEDASALPADRLDAAYRFCAAIAGDQPGFDEAMRALYRGGAGALAEATQDWPGDIRTHALALATPA